ncbi:helix-turn-helix domain-containing protein (plasmid) [Ralstonia pseudosolanacearum]|nr:helix-turn-helix domain-containing protein [Ralstonia solanacearum]
MNKMNLSEGEREELMAMQRSRTMAVGQVRRARLILLLDHGASREAIMTELRCDSRFITTWKTRFASERLAGLYGRHPGRAPRRDLARLEARVLDYTLRARLKIPRRCGVKAGCGKKKIESVRRSWLGRPSVTRAT